MQAGDLHLHIAGAHIFIFQFVEGGKPFAEERCLSV
jgi:hypothetical protein